MSIAFDSETADAPPQLRGLENKRNSTRLLQASPRAIELGDFLDYLSRPRGRTGLGALERTVTR